MSKPDPGRRAKLVEGSVAGALTRLTLPMVWGLLAVISQGVVDSYFAGRLGTDELAVMALVFPVGFTVSSIALGIGVGTSAVLARQIGAGKWDAVRHTVSYALLLGAIVMLVLTLLGYLTIEWLFPLLGASEALMPLVRSYMWIWYGGVIFFSPVLVGNSSLRANGDVTLASIIMTTAAVVNLVLDPVLMFGLIGAPRLELAGAAWATLGANGTATALSLFLIGNRQGWLTAEWIGLARLKEIWRAILNVGAPSALTNMISPLAAMILTRLSFEFGAPAAGGFGAANRVETLALIVPLALSACIGPFVGQNFGAGRIDRMRLAMKQSLAFAAIYGVLSAVVLAATAPPIAAAFSDNPEAQQVIRWYLWAVPGSYAFYGAIMIVAGAFNALGLPRPNFVLYSTRLIVLYLPLAFLGAWLFEMPGIIGAAVVANVVAGVMAFIWYRKRFPREEKKSPAQAAMSDR